MEELDELGPLLDIGEIGGCSGSTNRNSRRSFYDQPRTLSEEDDTFGILSNPSTSGTKHESFNPSETPVSTGLLVEIDSSQSSNENSDIASQSRLQSSKINGTELGLSMQSSRGISVSSITNSSSRNFGNISHISSVTEQSSGRSLLLSDSVFSSQSTMENDPMNWDMIMNEAQILASTINKDPVKSKKGSLGNMSPYTVGLDSPLLDLEKEFCKPDEFLVPLTPDRSPPIKDLSTAIGQSNLAAEVSPPLKALPEHEIDGDLQPTPKPAIHETPKNTHRPVNRSSRPRQLLAGHNKTPEKKTLQEANNSVEKQVKSKVQQSNVRRTSMTNPSLLVAQDQNVKKCQNINTSINNKPRLSLVERQSLSKPGTPVISRTTGTPSINNKINLKNVQSKINSGMPSTKGALNRTAPVKVQVPSAKKALVPNSGRKMAPPSASKYAISSRPGSAIGMAPGFSSTSKKGSATPLTGQRAVLQRQGSNLSNLPPRRPSSTTPMKSRLSLSFVTPAPAPAAPKFTPSGSTASSQPVAPRSGLKPPTPSRLMAPKIRTPSAAMHQPKPTQQQNIIQKPKSRSSLRFTALPSPAVGGGLRVGNKENDSLVCSTPAVQLGSVRSGQQGSGTLPPHPRAGLPSPIHTKRRAV